MTIEPRDLSDAVALFLGRTIDPALAGEIALMLAQPQELLPWLALRQGAFDTLPDVVAALGEAAAGAARPATRRPPCLSLSAPQITLTRDIHDALRQLVAENVERTSLAQEVNDLLSTLNETRPGAPDYEFHRRVK